MHRSNPAVNATERARWDRKKAVVDTATVQNDGDDKPVIKSKKTKRALAKAESQGKGETGQKAAASSETCRLKPKAERGVNTTCFACREVGYSAKDFPSTQPDTNGTVDGGTKAHHKSIVTAAAALMLNADAYRYGTVMRQVRFSKAYPGRPLEPDGSFPFASCFVRSGRRRLAGSCPKNNGKGVYPNGDASTDASLLGIGREARADEDDFHMVRQEI
ncbi:hypothetical protein EI94DRAFT_1782445 [Lactarius quietus]|nr:hypothetical protein EI94DRAFT_1782445 [Lactarius quietus]